MYNYLGPHQNKINLLQQKTMSDVVFVIANSRLNKKMLEKQMTITSMILLPMMHGLRRRMKQIQLWMLQMKTSKLKLEKMKMLLVLQQHLWKIWRFLQLLIIMKVTLMKMKIMRRRMTILLFIPLDSLFILNIYELSSLTCEPLMIIEFDNIV